MKGGFLEAAGAVSEEGYLGDADGAQTQNEICHSGEGSNDSLCTRKVGLILLKMEAKHKLTQSAVQSVWEAMCEVTNDVISRLRDPCVEGRVMAADWQGDLEQVRRMVGVPNLEAFGSEHMRKSFYKTAFNHVEAKEVAIGGSNCEMATGWYVPFKEMLVAILNLPEMTGYLKPQVPNCGEVLKDYIGGQFLRKHEFADPTVNFLQVILAYDDLELQNPLRSNKSHKLGMVYFTLGNIPPKWRSKLKSIFLVAIARSRDIRVHGLKGLLRNFLCDMTELRSTGVHMTVRGEQILVFGDLVACLCDTPAAAVLGGFKESSWAKKICRQCHASVDSFRQNFSMDSFVQRTMAEYEQQCDILESSAVGRNRGHWSKMFGVNKRSVLTEIPNFNVTQNLLQDPMHVLLEGVYSNVCALFLTKLMVEKTITVENLNTWIEQFPYSYIDRGSKPCFMNRVHLSKNSVLKQKAASIMLLVNILPLFLGQHVGEDDVNYRHFLRLTQIVQLCYVYICDTTTAGVLETEIDIFLREFVALYPEETVKPKMHFMVHLPKQIINFGPLRHHSTMRFEGKHGFFKSQKLTNFKNLPKTLAQRHQLWVTYNMSGYAGEMSKNYFGHTVEIKEGEIVRASECPPVLRCILAQHREIQDDWYETKCARKYGFTYKEGTVLLLNDVEGEMPHFGQVLQIVCLREEKLLFALELMETICWVAKYNSYHVKSTNTATGAKLDMLQHPWPLPMYEVNRMKLVTNRHTLHINT